MGPQLATLTHEEPPGSIGAHLRLLLTALAIVCAKRVAGSPEVVILAELDAALTRVGSDGKGILWYCHGSDEITAGRAGCSLRYGGGCRCGGGREYSHGGEDDERLEVEHVGRSCLIDLG